MDAIKLLKHDGSLYVCTNKRLEEIRGKIKDLCFELNYQTKPSDTKRQKELLSEILSYEFTGHITTPFFCDYGFNVKIGQNFYANHNLVILDCAPVIIGDNVLIGPNCVLAAPGHPLSPTLRAQGYEFAKDIVIGNDVWIGSNVTILPGVKIGNNCVIGAGSIVTRNIPDNSVAVGAKCNVIKNIADVNLDEELIKKF